MKTAHPAGHKHQTQAEMNAAQAAKDQHAAESAKDKPVFNDELQHPPTDDKRKMVYATEDERWTAVMGILEGAVNMFHRLAEHPSLGISRAQADVMAQHLDALQPHPAEDAKPKEG